MLGNDGVETLTVGSHHILDIADVLQASLNLKRDGTSLDEFLQVGRLVEVLQRQEVALMFQFTAISIEEVELHATDLCAGSPIGRTAKAILRGIAETTVADAEGTMNEDLQLYVGHCLVNGGNLFNRQLTRQDDATETQGAQPAHLLWCAVVSLRGGVESQQPTLSFSLPGWEHG